VVPAEYRTIAKTKRQNIFHKQCRPLNFVVNCPRGISPMGEYKVVPELCKALVAVQAEFRGVAKDGRNPAFNSRYMTLDSILDDLRPLRARCWSKMDCLSPNQLTTSNSPMKAGCHA
jgi:hypothetical protein